MKDKSQLLFKETLLEQAGLVNIPEEWSIVQIADILSEDRGISVGVMYPPRITKFNLGFSYNTQF